MNNKNFDDEYKDLFASNDDEDDFIASYNSGFDISSNYSDVLDLNSIVDDQVESVDDAVIAKMGFLNKIFKKKTNNKSVTRKQKIIKTLLIIFLCCVIVCCIGVGVGLYYFTYHIDGTLNEDLEALSLEYTSIIYVQDKEGNWVEYQRLHGANNRIWVDYDEQLAKAKDESYTGIPYNLASAFVAVEDKRFYEHSGVDWRRTASAAFGVLTSGSMSGHGGSSIDQQLVRNLTGDRERGIPRKLREIKRALYIDKEYSKETILECYMNTIAMGNGIYGVEVAAEYYFGKKVQDLTIAECASLAGITNLPEYYRPDINPNNNLERRNIILGLMLDQGYITEEEYDVAINEELTVASNKAVLDVDVNNYFVDALIDDVVEALMEKYKIEKTHAELNVYNGGYKIYATIKPEIQEAMESVYTDENYILTSKDGAKLQGAMTIMDYEGHIVGIVGGMGEKTKSRDLNRATMSPRQPGSTIKPLSAYAPAINKNIITYSSIVDDSDKSYSGWRPTNWYGSYYGNITAKRALEISVNTIPVLLINKMGLGTSYNFLTQNLGMKYLNENDRYSYASLGMGGMNRGITTTESAAAFAIFGNGGNYYEPTTFVEIRDSKDNVIVSNAATPLPAINKDSATIMNYMLQNVVYGPEGTGRGAAGFISNMRIFAKTGTSNDNYNIWFVGGSPYYVASSWCGYDQDAKISKSNQARVMWGAVMKKVHSGYASKSFSGTGSVQVKLYCTQTGLLATTSCPTEAYGYYKLTGQKYCTEHSGDKIGGTTVGDANDYLSNMPSSSEVVSSDEQSGGETSNSTETSSTNSAVPTD